MPHYERELALVPLQSSQMHARIRSADTADALFMLGVLARLDRCRGRARLQLVELFTTETVLFVGQIIGVIWTMDNPDIIIKLARKVCVYYYFIQHIQLHDCIQELFLMITCMSAVVRVMFPALPEDTSSSLVPFFLYLDRSRENVKNVMLSP